MNKELLKLHVRQLSRLINHQEIELSEAFYIIFSDNLSVEQISEIATINFNSDSYDSKLHDMLLKEIQKRK